LSNVRVHSERLYPAKTKVPRDFDSLQRRLDQIGGLWLRGGNGWSDRKQQMRRPRDDGIGIPHQPDPDVP
jgi:hypothetical protein